MDRRELQRSMYELGGASTAQRIVLAALAGLVIVFAWWLLAAHGADALVAWAGWHHRTADRARSLLLAGAFSVYFVRILFTLFVFLRRGVGWNEVFTIAPWLLFLVVFLSVAASPAPPGSAAVLGGVLFILGSWVNSSAEYARHRWKERPENRGRVYTHGWFRWSRHPNYLGDLLSFSGLCVVSGAWLTAIIPVLMLAGFVFVNIPVLDAHLRDHYGPAFDDYARRTRKLIPFIY